MVTAVTHQTVTASSAEFYTHFLHHISLEMIHAIYYITSSDSWMTAVKFLTSASPFVNSMPPEF